MEAMRVPKPSVSRSPDSRFSQTASGCFAGSFARYARNSPARGKLRVIRFRGCSEFAGADDATAAEPSSLSKELNPSSRYSSARAAMSGSRRSSCVQIQFQRHVRGNCRQLFGHHDLLALLLQRFAIAFVGNFVGVIQGASPRCRISGSARSRPFRRCLWRRECCRSCRPSAPSRRSLFPAARRGSPPPSRVHDDVALGAARSGPQNAHAAVDELHHVLVVGDHQHLELFLRGLRGQRADDVVGLVTVESPGSAGAWLRTAVARRGAARRDRRAWAGAALCTFQKACRGRSALSCRKRSQCSPAGSPSAAAAGYLKKETALWWGRPKARSCGSSAHKTRDKCAPSRPQGRVFSRQEASGRV